jgi:hypothetical protein
MGENGILLDRFVTPCGIGVANAFFFRFSLQVYSFVPIPGAQQHKRPRRRYEEIERMYKCGWNGCEKAYGTLNHLNAHVTMQSHGAKRTPEGEIHPLFLCMLPVFSRCRRFSRGLVCRKWLDWVSAGSYALVSYTRFRGAAVAWPTAWRLGLYKLAYLSRSQQAATFFAPDLIVDSPPSTPRPTLPWISLFFLSSHHPHTDFVFHSRIQGDSQGMEGPQEGGRVSA